jgi:cytochrome c
MTMNKLAISVCCLVFLTTPALAIETPSLELGKTLFESSELGTKNRSCSSCHPQGKGLDLVGDFDDEELKDIINACIRDAQGGKLISTESQEMQALLSYVRKFQKN